MKLWFGILSAMDESAVHRQAIARRGRRLEYFTIVWNSLEGIIAVVAGGIVVSLFFPRYQSEKELLASYQREDAARPDMAPATAPGG